MQIGLNGRDAGIQCRLKRRERIFRTQPACPAMPLKVESVLHSRATKNGSVKKDTSRDDRTPPARQKGRERRERKMRAVSLSPRLRLANAENECKKKTEKIPPFTV